MGVWNFLTFFPAHAWRSDPPTDFDAKRLNRRGFTQVCAFCSKNRYFSYPLISRAPKKSKILQIFWQKIFAWFGLSHAHTVVWECCKDDRQSQLGMAKFDPQPTLNPWTDRHQIWNTWLRRGYLPPQIIRGQSAQGFCPTHTWNIHPKPSNVYFFFFSVLQKV